MGTQRGYMRGAVGGAARPRLWCPTALTRGPSTRLVRVRALVGGRQACQPRVAFNVQPSLLLFLRTVPSSRLCPSWLHLVQCVQGQTVPTMTLTNLCVATSAIGAGKWLCALKWKPHRLLGANRCGVLH